MLKIKFLSKFAVTVMLSLFSGIVLADECKTLTATGNSEYPPYLWRKGDGSTELLGANRLILDEVGRRLGVDIHLQDVGSWARAQDMLKTGRIDLMAGAFFTIPRVQYMDYIHPAFLHTESVVWVQNERYIKFAAKEDLKGLPGVTVINNSFGQEFDEYAASDLDIMYVSSLAQAFKMLSRGRAKYALYEKNPGLAYARALGHQDLTILTPSISSEGLFLTVSHQSKCNTPQLRGALAKAVHDLMTEGFMDRALEQGLSDWQEFTR